MSDEFQGSCFTRERKYLVLLLEPKFPRFFCAHGRRNRRRRPPFAMKIKVVGPPERVYSVCIPSADVDFEGRCSFFWPFHRPRCCFVCELTICMEIDQSLRFTRRVMNFQIAVLSRCGLEDPCRLPSPHPRSPCFIFSATALTLYHCLLEKKTSAQ